MKCKLNNYENEILKGIDDTKELVYNEHSQPVICDAENSNVNFYRDRYCQIMELKINNGLVVRTINRKDELLFRIIDYNELVTDGIVKKELNILVSFKDRDGIPKISVNYMKTTSRFLMDDIVEMSSICSIVPNTTCAYFDEESKPRKTINVENFNVTDYLFIILNSIKNSNNGDLWKMFRDGIQVICPGLKVAIEDFLKTWMNMVDDTIETVQKEITKQERDILMNKVYIQVLQKIKRDLKETQFGTKEKPEIIELTKTSGI